MRWSMRRKKQGAGKPVLTGYDYFTPEAREETVSALFARAVSARSGVEADWRRYNDYYNFAHDITEELRQLVRRAENALNDL